LAREDNPQPTRTDYPERNKGSRRVALSFQLSEEYMSRVSLLLLRLSLHDMGTRQSHRFTASAENSTIFILRVVGTEVAMSSAREEIYKQ
jgi:hypothetical protein